MSEPAKPKKTPFDYFLTVLSAATPFLVIIFGALINHNVTQTEIELKKMETQVNSLKTEMETKIAPIEAMKPFMDMMSEDSTITRNIMGAYGIYMLKKGNDSKIAAQMIASTQQVHLYDVLTDIAEDDSIVRNWINRFKDNAANITADQLLLDSTDSNLESLSDYQKYLLRLTGELERSQLTASDNAEDYDQKEATEEPDGWIYIGNRSLKAIEDAKKLIGDTPDWDLVREHTFTLTTDVNLRENKPSPPSYRNGKLLRVLQEETEFKVDTFTIDKKGHHWARIIVQ